MAKHSFIVSLFLLATSNALACNPGQGTGQCGFYDATGRWVATRAEYDASFQQQGGGTVYTPPPPPITVILPDRFGAVARAINNHGFSSVYNMNSKQEARRKVLQDCKKGNASPCKIYLEYGNGCISMASGKGPFNHYYPVYSFSRQQGQTQRDVMEKCSAQYSDCGIAIEEECSIVRPPR